MSEKKLTGLFLLSFAAISVFFMLGKMGDRFEPFVNLGGDMAVYASIAAAQDDPSLFVNDPFLSNEKNINSYRMVFFPALRGLKALFGNYGSAGLFLLPFVIFLHMTGYYALGRSIFRNSWMGFYAALIISIPTSTYYDYWGIFLDALPRFMYQALLPFLLALAITRGRNPNWWFVIFAGVGLLTYLHPVSAPVWIAALTLGLWVSAEGSSAWKKAQKMAVAFLILAIVLSPFLTTYFSSVASSASAPEDYDQVMAVLKDRFFTMRDTGLISVLLNFFSSRMGFALDLVWYLVVTFAAAGAVYGMKRRESHDLFPAIRQILAWIAGIFLVGAMLPSIERAVFAQLRTIPPEFEVLRTIRFWTPLLLLLAMCFFWMVKEKFQRRQTVSLSAVRIASVAFFVAFLTAWGIRGFASHSDFRAAVYQNKRCWTEAKVICSLPERDLDLLEALNVIRDKTPVSAVIFAEGENLAIRYYAFRSLAYSYKDGAPLAYTDLRQLLAWNDQYRTMEKLGKLKDMPNRRVKYMGDLVELARTAKSNYLLLNAPYDSDLYYPVNLELIFSNNSYSLYAINR